MTAYRSLHRPDRYPLSSRYDPEWLLRLDMGPHPLWQLEDLLTLVPLRPGQRVLDLVGWEAAARHSPGWWATHWASSGLVDGITARMQEGSRDD